MQAAILHAQHRPLVVDEVSLPPSLDVGQVLVNVHYSSICGSQLGEIDGVKGPDRYLPHLLGHEGSGTVEAIGPGVTQVQVGQQVVLHWRKGPGIEAKPPIYTWRGRDCHAGWVTTFNQQAVVSENRLTPLPEDFNLGLAPLLGCALTTAYGVICRDAKVLPGESLLILGAGGVGLAQIQIANAMSAYPIMAVDRHASRLELARELGATHCVLAKEGYREEISSIQTHFDIVIDNTGHVPSLKLAYELTGPSGRTVMVGVIPKGQHLSLNTLPLHFGKRLIGSHGGDSNPREDIPRLIRLIQARRLPIHKMIGETYDLAQINQAIEDLRKGRTRGRSLISLQEASLPCTPGSPQSREAPRV